MHRTIPDPIAYFSVPSISTSSQIPFHSINHTLSPSPFALRQTFARLLAFTVDKSEKNGGRGHCFGSLPRSIRHTTRFLAPSHLLRHPDTPISAAIGKSRPKARAKNASMHVDRFSTMNHPSPSLGSRFRFRGTIERSRPPALSGIRRGNTRGFVVAGTRADGN